MLQNIVRVLGGDPNKKEIEKYALLSDEINQYEAEFEKLNDEQLREKTGEFRNRLAEGETLDDILIEAFAAVREASKRTIGLRHYDIQMIGGITLHKGKIAEMRTGEGKTLVATLPLYLNALKGLGVHLVTVNDYLARRDARWMAPVYNALGMTVGVLQMTARSEESRSAFLVDLEKISSLEDQHQLRSVHRSQAYQADITYGTNSEFGFDYLRDNLTMRLIDRVQRKHYFAIVDEVDNILIDEARTPLIISGPSQDESEYYYRMSQIVRQLQPEDYEINERDRNVTLSEIGESHVEELLQEPLRDPERPEDITPEQARLLGHLEQALRAQFLFKRNKDYIVQSGKVIIVDEFTGRLMPGRRWSEGLHQAVEAKEGVKVEPENITYATITLQNYFRMYEKLAGMTGTALTEAEEFHKIYTIDVLPIPTNLEYEASKPGSKLFLADGRDENNYKYSYYAERGDIQKNPIYWKRKDFTDVVYRSHEAKLRSITQEIIRLHILGRPQLVGTTSVESSENLSQRLSADTIRRQIQVLLIRQAWMEKYNLEFIEKEIPELAPLNKPIKDLDNNAMRQLARGLGISLNPEEPINLQRLLKILNLDEEHTGRLVQVLQGGIPHQVLNARKHDTESQIIANAGRFGAVTIATNMAGRGVDIKLGGELPEDLIADINRVLNRAGFEAYEMTNDQRREKLIELDEEEYGIYDESVKTFLQKVGEMEKVRQLGGLHVIGSERHEARRIDNQLRGRAARQGDPGSSRFYLSLEDDLMRLFGGGQVEGLWKRIMIDESQPLEMNILGRLVEQSQERVEGANFDIRKHLLEYDDVLNSQRKRIYSQRDMVFSKENLNEDILEMLQVELKKRIPESLADEEGPWKLMAFLEEIQPAFFFDSITFPAFSQKVLVEDIRDKLTKKSISKEFLMSVMMETAERAVNAEEDHVTRSAAKILDKTADTLQENLRERFDNLDIFIENLNEADENEEQPRRTPDLLEELTNLVRVRINLSASQLEKLADSDPAIKNMVRVQIENALLTVSINRLIGAVERRLEENLNLKTADLVGIPWQDIANRILQSIGQVFEQRRERFFGEQGQVKRDLQSEIEKISIDEMDERMLSNLMIVMAQGTRYGFDSKTHQKTAQRFMRISNFYLAAHIIESETIPVVIDRVIEHLSKALEMLQEARGQAAWQQIFQANATLIQLDQSVQDKIKTRLGSDHFQEISNTPPMELEENDRFQIRDILGSHLQNEAYRELLLRTISDQWVEYLTKVEALRVSIGLEAYGQRDPLVQYKSKATEMFQGLLGEIRMAVIRHVFTFHTRRSTGAPVEQSRAESQPSASESAAAVRNLQDTKSKRHKHRKRH